MAAKPTGPAGGASSADPRPTFIWSSDYGVPVVLIVATQNITDADGRMLPASRVIDRQLRETSFRPAKPLPAGFLYWQLCEDNPATLVTECTQPSPLTIPFTGTIAYDYYPYSKQLVVLTRRANCAAGCTMAVELVAGGKVVQRFSVANASTAPRSSFKLTRKLKKGLRVVPRVSLVSNGGYSSVELKPFKV